MSVHDFVYEVLGAFEALLTALLMPLKHLFPHYYFFRTPGLIDRETGAISGEPAPFMITLKTSLLYSTWWGQHVAKWGPFRRFLSKNGKHMKEVADKPKSAKDIKSLIKAYDINVWECEKPPEAYRTLNDFFARKLKEGVRPITRPADPSIAVQPADSRQMVFETVQRAEKLWIKGNDFSIHKLLGSAYDAADWEHATLVISRKDVVDQYALVLQRRLSPTDYHRVHSPVTGRLKRVVWLGKTLYGCTSPAVHSAVDIYGDSERAVLEFETPSFGTVMFCVIGATEVGSINLIIKEGDHVTKGQNVSYYQYGGSMVITLFHHNSIVLDEDLRRNSASNKETRVKMGQSLGSAKNSKR